MGMTESFQAPKGMYRVVSLDQFDHTYFTIGDYPTRQEADAAAEERAREPNGSPPEFSDIYLVFDDRGQRVRRVTYASFSNQDP